MYSPKPNPPVDESLQGLADYLQEELQAIARALGETTELELREVSAEPEKPRKGMIVYADGVSWDPGSGEGQYYFDGTNWVIQRTGVEPNSYGVMTDGTTPAPAEVAGDTFKFRFANGVKATTTNDDATHGDNVLHELDIAAITAATPVLSDLSPFADVSAANVIRRATYQELLDLIGSLATEGSPDPAADFLALFDGSGSVAKKLALSNIGARTLISTTTLSGGGNTITIPAGYSDVEVIVRDMSSSSGLGQNYQVRFSEDSGTSFVTFAFIVPGAFGLTNDSTLDLVNTNNVNDMSCILKLTGYDTGLSKPLRGHIHMHTAFAVLDAMGWSTNSAAPINAVRVQTSIGSSLNGGDVELWGIR